MKSCCVTYIIGNFKLIIIIIIILYGSGNLKITLTFAGCILYLILVADFDLFVWILYYYPITFNVMAADGYTVYYYHVIITRLRIFWICVL